MPAAKRVKHVPQHRREPAPRVVRPTLRTAVALTSVAVVGTSVVVGAGLAGDEPAGGVLAAARAGGPVAVPSGTPAPVAAPTTEDLDALLAARRTGPVSRSDRRGVADPRKQAVLAPDAGATGDNAVTRTEDSSDADPRTVARTLLAAAGLSASQFDCLDSLWTRESGWRVDADNPASSAYGIPQALPGSKMSAFGADWATNPVTQVRWGLDYVEDRYGSPCGAWAHSQAYGWY